MMIEVSFRFYAQLNDLLPAERRGRRFTHRLPARASVKDTIEAIGVPHPEVDVILVNGRAESFACHLCDNDDVAVYPPFRSIDTSLARVGADPPRPVRFVLDIHLGRLASFLRLAGFDTVVLDEDPDVAATAARDDRVVLTRDVALLKRSIVRHGHWVRHTDPELQFAEVLVRFDLVGDMAPFARCLRCNTLLVAVEADAVADQLLPETRAAFRQFRKCPGCARVYWQGSHYDRLARVVERARVRVFGANATPDSSRERKIGAHCRPAGGHEGCPVPLRPACPLAECEGHQPGLGNPSTHPNDTRAPADSARASHAATQVPSHEGRVMVEIRHVLCPVDFSDFSRRALDHAVAISGWYKSRLTVLYVHHVAVSTIAQFVGLAAAEEHPLSTAECVQLQQQLQALTPPEALLSVPVEFSVAQGDVTAEILSAAELADIVVMGTHGRSGFDHLILGSVTDKVLRDATCPVLTIPRAAPDMPELSLGVFHHIVAAVDFSEPSLYALDYALSLAVAAQAQLTVLHVVDISREGSKERARTDRNATGSALERLRPLVADAARVCARVRERVEAGEPCREILRVAREHHAVLIVIGAHSSSLADRMFGSTAQRVIRQAICPVLTIRKGRPAGQATS